MKRHFLLVIFSVIFAASVFGQGSWLDRPITSNWNTASGIVPAVPRAAESPNSEQCRGEVRAPESIADRAVTRAGWFLYGPAQVYGPVTLVTAMAGVDGMCRPDQTNAFVFVANRFAGTLSPEATGARLDGTMHDVRLINRTELAAEFARYTSSDPLCCPSQSTSVSYSIEGGPRPVVKPGSVSTSAVCGNDGEFQTQDNVITGTVTYRQRSALPPKAVIVVKLVDVSREDVSAVTISEQRIDAAGKQVPFSFDLVFDWKKIQQANRYAVQAQIMDGGRLLFTTNTSYPVLTQGNPRVVELVLVPVGGGFGGVGSAVIRGTISHAEKITLPAKASVTVQLIDSANPEAAAIVENTFETNGRQFPIPFELTYDPRSLGRQRNYEMRAEIKVDGEVRFRTAAGQAINLRGVQSDIELVVESVNEGPTAITGHSINLSKLGSGTIQIEGRNSMRMITASVSVQTEGTAAVSVSRFTTTYTFNGRLTYFDDSTLRITVENSGDANASGEIEVRYSGSRLNSIIGNNLTLDGQKVTLRF